VINLVSNGASEYRIVIRENHTPSEETAAAELSSYISAISGAVLPSVSDSEPESAKEICIGFTSRDSGETAAELEALGEEGYIIKVSGKKLFILGSGVRGAIYGVYTFLEKCCGCRFYTNDFERVPKSADISVEDICIRETPVFEYRNAYWFAQSGEFISVKLKNNGGMGHELSERVGGGIDYTGDFCHTMGYLSEKCERGDACWDQPCLTDEEIYEKVLKNVKKELRENPGGKIISVSQLDGDNGECSCEKCSAVYEEEHSHMGNLLRFVNRIQADIRDEFPGVHVDTLAYRFSRIAPDVTVPDPDVIVRLCDIECGFRHPLELGGKVPVYGDEVNFAANLKKWGKVTNHLYIWDYTTNFTNHSIPFVNFGVLRENLRFFAENGITGVFEQGNIQSHNGEFGELRGYLIEKLLWNPYMSAEEYRQHMEDFANDYYGAAAKYILQYIDLELECSKDSNFGVYFDDASHYVYVPGMATKLDGGFEFFRLAEELFNKAEEAVADDKLSRSHVRRSRIQIHNYKYFILRKKTDELPDGAEGM